MKLNPFKKYSGFIKAGALDALSYKFTLYAWLIGDILGLIVTSVLWFAIYNQSAEEIINGFSFQEMMNYVVTARIVAQLTTCSQSFYIEGTDIREGGIAINLTKPINYRKKLYFNSLGVFLADFVILFIPLYLIAILVLHFAFSCDLPTWYNVLFFLISVFLSMSIYDSFNFILGQLAFVTGTLFGIMIIKDTLLSFLSGSLIPLSFFPSWAQMVLRCLPFSSLMETPTYILMNKYDPLTSLIKVSMQLGHFVLLEVICYLVNRRMIKHVVSVGG